MLSASTPELYSRGNSDCAACREKDMQGMLGRLLSLTRCMSRHPGASTDSISVMWRSDWASVKCKQLAWSSFRRQHLARVTPH